MFLVNLLPQKNKMRSVLVSDLIFVLVIGLWIVYIKTRQRAGIAIDDIVWKESKKANIKGIRPWGALMKDWIIIWCVGTKENKQ